MELEPILEILDNINCDLVMAEDYNIDLLKLNDRLKYTDFFDNMLSVSLFPKITSPTRISNTSCTLNDNIYYRLSNNTMDLSSGIVHSGISDHFPCFVSISTGGQTSNSTPTVIKKVINSQKAMSNFIEEISSVDFTSKLNTDINSNPDTNYNIFINTILDVKNKHFPKTFVKFRKHKHKINEWITYGIIRSIKTRDAMHLTLKRTSPHAAEYPTLKHNISVFNKILKKAIREAKNEYYSNLFEQYKNDIKKTWQNISRILNKSNKKKNNIKKILVNGNITTDKTTIAIGFNHGLPWCVKYMARGPPVATRPDGEAGGFCGDRRPEGHVFHTSRQAMIKTYYSTSIRKTMVQNCSYLTQMKSTTTAIDDSNRRRNKLVLGCSREATAPLILIFELIFLWLNIGRHFKGITQFHNCHSPKHTSKKYYPVINIFREICTKIIT